MSAALEQPIPKAYLSWRQIALGYIMLACVILMLCTFGYVAFFHEALINDEWMDVKGFSRILIPDVFLYISLTESMDELEWLQLAVAGVKNALGPVVMWKLGGEDWYGMAAVNLAIIAAIVVYTIKLAKHFDIDLQSTWKICITLLILPAMVYYSVGPAKELPTLLGVTGFFYHFVKRQTFRWMLLALVAILFRYQLLAVIVPFVFVARFTANPLRCAVQLMVVAAMVYPVIAQVQVLSAEETAIFREASGSQTGAVIETIRDKVPVVSALAVGVRVSQSVLEPVMNSLHPDGLIESGSISIITLVYLLSFIPMAPYWFRTLMWIKELYGVKHPKSRDTLSVYAFIVLFAVPVGGFSFVHHRYLFPLTVLLLFAGYESVKQARIRWEFAEQARHTGG